MATAAEIAELPFEPNEVHAFIDSTEPACAAHRAYAAEDAADLEYIARELVSFWRRACPRLAGMAYATKDGDVEGAIDCLVDQITDTLTPDADRLFRRYVELYAAPDAPAQRKAA